MAHPLLLPLLLFLSGHLAAVHADPISFGTGLSSNRLYQYELDLFNYTVSPSSVFATLTHFWIAGAAPQPDIDSALIRYYIDGESEASIQFTPSLLCGAGFNDGTGPWGGRWMGKGAANGGWWSHFRVPFQQSIRITGQLTTNSTSTLVWTILRGNEDLHTTIGGFTLPVTARLTQSRIQSQLYNPLDWVTLADLPSASGLLFAHVLQAESTNLYFLEGCYHAYTPYKTAFPGLLLSTGTEDYFSSADYFDGGIYHFDHAGLTHFTVNSTTVRMSSYRLHELDPVLFNGGIRLVWRIGDVIDENGFKCIVDQGGVVVSSPNVTRVTSYVWTYVWPSESNIAVEVA